MAALASRPQGSYDREYFRSDGSRARILFAAAILGALKTLTYGLHLASTASAPVRIARGHRDEDVTQL